MHEFKIKKSNYKLFIRKWEIAVILEAGYRKLHENEDCSEYIEVCENLYFSIAFVPNSNSVQLSDEEINDFCKGLHLVSDQIMDKVNHKPCLIQLQSILFSDCNIQQEALMASAIKWASEAFAFPMPIINVTFDDTIKPCGKYIFDFSNLV